MKTITNPKAMMSNCLPAEIPCMRVLRPGMDQMGKELEKQIEAHKNTLYFAGQMIAEGKRTRTTHKKESFTQITMMSYL